MGDLTGAIVGMIIVAIIFGALTTMGLMWIIPDIWEWIKPIIHEFTK
jgi:hypothetical protein